VIDTAASAHPGSDEEAEIERITPAKAASQRLKRQADALEPNHDRTPSTAGPNLERTLTVTLRLTKLGWDTTYDRVKRRFGGVTDDQFVTRAVQQFIGLP
jgi:hypothetical protein